VLAIVCDASPTLPDSADCAHLAYLMAAAGSIPRRLQYCRSTDDGLTWSAPELMAQDSVALPALFARSSSAGVVDLAYARSGFMRWRGGSHHGSRWGPEEAVRLGACGSSASAIARARRRVFLMGESATHQVVGAPSRNGAVNWERAIAIARGSDQPRMPALDWGGGRFWVAFAQGDSLLMARWATDPWLPALWSAPTPLARTRCAGPPAVVALPDSAAIVVYATPDGIVASVRVSD
jgi:hypothetical protein